VVVSLPDFPMSERVPIDPSASEMDDAAAPSPELMERLAVNHRELLGFLEKRLGSRAEAEDVLQEAFVKGVEHERALRNGEAATAWFYRTLRNAVIDRYRRRGSQERGLAAFAAELETAEQPTAELERSVCACVGSLATTLKPEYADALRRIEIDGQSVSGYATELGIQPNNAAVRVHRAREALRKRVLTTCGTCAEHGCLDCSCRSPHGARE
jgi:RNA polymerase sigma factor (sigma-70 family)